MHRSQPTDLLPNALVGDCADALTWWLQNPVLVYHYPNKMEATAAIWEAMPNDERMRLLWRLREKRGKAVSSKARPEGLPTMEQRDLVPLYDRMPDLKELVNVRSFAFRLTSCELPWLAKRLEAALAARDAQAAQTDETLPLAA